VDGADRTAGRSMPGSVQVERFAEVGHRVLACSWRLQAAQWSVKCGRGLQLITQTRAMEILAFQNAIKTAA
jgi:hypothetical protein